MMEDEENEVAFRSETVEDKFAKLTECLREVQMAMEMMVF